MCFLGNSGSFSTVRQPPKRWVCPFQEGVNLSPFCDNEKCGYGLYCPIFFRCQLRVKHCPSDCRVCGNGDLNINNSQVDFQKKSLGG